MDVPDLRGLPLAVPVHPASGLNDARDAAALPNGSSKREVHTCFHATRRHQGPVPKICCLSRALIRCTTLSRSSGASAVERCITSCPFLRMRSASTAADCTVFRITSRGPVCPRRTCTSGRNRRFCVRLNLYAALLHYASRARVSCVSRSGDRLRRREYSRGSPRISPANPTPAQNGIPSPRLAL